MSATAFQRMRREASKKETIATQVAEEVIEEIEEAETITLAEPETEPQEIATEQEKIEESEISEEPVKEEKTKAEPKKSTKGGEK